MSGKVSRGRKKKTNESDSELANKEVTWDDIQHIAFVDLGLSADEFGWMTLFQFWARRKHKHNEDLKELQLVRWHASIVANFGGLGSKKWIRPKDLLPVDELDKVVQSGEVMEEAELTKSIDDFLEVVKKSKKVLAQKKKNGSN